MTVWISRTSTRVGIAAALAASLVVGVGGVAHATPEQAPTRGKVSGSIFVDANKNGKRDKGEKGVAAVRITFTNNATKRAATVKTTSRNGFYSANLNRANYTMSFTLPATCKTMTTPAAALTFAVAPGSTTVRDIGCS